MKFLVAFALSLALALASSPMVFTEEAAPKAGLPALKVKPKKPPEGYSLAPLEGDSEKVLRFKAALRLLNGYTITMNRLNACVRRQDTPVELQKARASFFARNGNTLGLVMAHLKRSGGLTKEIRAALDQEAAKKQKEDNRPCFVLGREVAMGMEDLYKGEKYAADYQLLKGGRR